MTELRTFKMTGTIEEYISAYKDLYVRAPDTINFDEAGPQLDFYKGLPPQATAPMSTLKMLTVAMLTLLMLTL
ncbi:hypothetical protein DSO57_1023861 [Entomophthora muscae]|uniref:Uncharacterized protein n=1 Tax=Entomophthora muscae TaxID=34485 RepID=A0ACC2RTV5_9FUNG|nr:hypothetical protein DSO57_1023861 [Entomophthora muscae]